MLDSTNVFNVSQMRHFAEFIDAEKKIHSVQVPASFRESSSWLIESLAVGSGLHFLTFLTGNGCKVMVQMPGDYCPDTWQYFGTSVENSFESRLFRTKVQTVEAVQLLWKNWNSVCDFVPRPWFEKGVFLNDVTKEPLSEGASSHTIGMILNIYTSDGRGRRLNQVTAVEGDWIVKIGENYLVMTSEEFSEAYERIS